jgi:hypothetical protein
MINRSLARLVLLTFVAMMGCHGSYRSYRVHDDCETLAGVPAMMHKTYLATVTWSEDRDGVPITTTHVAKLPVMYAVDVLKAPLGTTKASVKMNADGQLIEANAEQDQQIDEIISSVGDLTGNLPLGGQRGESSSGITFTPDLDEMTGSADEGKLGYPLGISFMELSTATPCCNTK